VSDFDAYEDDMARFSKLSDQDIERLLAGKAVAGDGEHEELAAFVRTLSAFAKAPDGATEARHLRAMMEAARASRASDTQSRSEEPIAGVSQRRKLVQRNPLSSLAAKLVLAGVVVLALFSGAASAGILPNGVQKPVADVAGNVGLSIPDGEDANNVDDGAVNNVDEKDQGNTDDGAKDDKDEGDVDNKDDGQVDDKDNGAVDDKDEGDQNNVQEGEQGDRNDDVQGNVQQGSQDDKDEGIQDTRPPAAPQGSQGQDSGGDQGGGGDQGDGGDQGGGDN